MAPVFAKVALYCTDSIFHKEIHFVAGHRWYHHNQLAVSIKLFISWLMIFLVNYVLSFFITEIPLFTFEIAILICCLKLRFSSSKIPRCFWEDTLSAWTLLRLMVGWTLIFFFLENSTYWARLLEIWIKKHFPIINPSRDWLKVIRDVSSAKSLTLDFD